MDDLLATAPEHPGLSREDLERQMWLTGYVTVGLFAIAVGIDFIGNGLPGFGHILTTVGLAALVYLAADFGVRQHRAARDLDHPGLTIRERLLLLAGLATVVVTAAL